MKLPYYETDFACMNKLKDYEEVLLFGPTNAKNELFNLLKDDRHFEKIKIEVKSGDKMTDLVIHTT